MIRSIGGTSSRNAMELVVSRDRRYLQLTERLSRYARQGTVAIVLEGESGTGKSVLARLVHELSPRAGQQFQEVSLAALDDGVAGSELFGYVPGAFTDARTRRAGHFVSATGGTLFLDEFGKASAAVQRKLLRVIETGSVWPIGSDRPINVDVRLVVATIEPLEKLVTAGTMLPDLYARLGCFHLRIPPLRERAADIPALVESFLRKHAPRCGYSHQPPDVQPDLLKMLRKAPWPYNVRQLEAVLTRLLVDAAGAPTLTLELCDDELIDWLSIPRLPRTRLSPEVLQRAIATAGSVVGAAKELGVHRSTVHRHLAEEKHAYPPVTDAMPP